MPCQISRLLGRIWFAGRTNEVPLSSIAHAYVVPATSVMYCVIGLVSYSSFT